MGMGEYRNGTGAPEPEVALYILLWCFFIVACAVRSIDARVATFPNICKF